MIQMGSKISVMDNSGAKIVEMIGVVGKNKRIATVGDVISVAVKSAIPNAKVKKGQVFRAVIIGSKQAIKRSNGMVIRFPYNGVVLLSKQGEPVGTRVFGPVARETRTAGFFKISSLASEVI